MAEGRRELSTTWASADAIHVAASWHAGVKDYGSAGAPLSQGDPGPSLRFSGPALLVRWGRDDLCHPGTEGWRPPVLTVSPQLEEAERTGPLAQGLAPLEPPLLLGERSPGPCLDPSPGLAL